jgi:hypothetical protein
MGSQGIVAYLERDHGEATSSWWRQSITVGYEQARGKRVVGETTDTGLQVGVQKSVDATGDRSLGPDHLAARFVAG